MKKGLKIALGVCIIGLLSGLHANQTWNEPIYNTEIESDGYENIGMLNGGTVVEQQFYCNLNGMLGIRVQPVLFGRTDNGTLSYSLRDSQSQEVVAQGVIDPAGWTDGEYNEITFDPVADSKGKSYTLAIQDENTSADKGISFYVTEKGKNALLKVKGQEFPGTMVMQIKCDAFNLQEFVVLSGMIVYILLFIKLLYKFLG